MAQYNRGPVADRHHDGAVACTASILNWFPAGYFGPDKARVYQAIYARVKATLAAESLLAFAQWEAQLHEPSAN